MTLMVNLKDARLRQAETTMEWALILINVKQYDEKETFIKGEEAYVTKKNYEKNVYYIIKIKDNKHFFHHFSLLHKPLHLL